jgi:hypothetical protein
MELYEVSIKSSLPGFSFSNTIYVVANGYENAIFFSTEYMDEKNGTFDAEVSEIKILYKDILVDSENL